MLELKDVSFTIRKDGEEVPFSERSEGMVFWLEPDPDNSTLKQ